MNSFKFTTDYYEVLEVPRNASQKDIKSAYYNKAKKYHPDANVDDINAPLKFQNVSEAYEILGDEGRRKEYDDAVANKPKERSFTTEGSQFESFHSTIDPEELFKKIFGNVQGTVGKGGGIEFPEIDFADTDFGYGPTRELTVDLTFKEAAVGCEKEVELKVVETCPLCMGKGTQFGYKPIVCPGCGGKLFAFTI